MLRRRPGNEPPSRNTATDEEMFCFRRVKHYVKNLIEDVADQKSEACGFGDTYFIDWKQVSKYLNQNLNIVSISEDGNKVRVRSPKNAHFYVYPEEYRPLRRLLLTLAMSGISLFLLGMMMGMTVGNNEFLLRYLSHILNSLGTAVAKGGFVGGTIGLMCGISLGVGVTATALWTHLRRFSISTSDIFLCGEGFVDSDAQLLATFDVSDVRMTDLSDEE